jgi:hypothetical protein
MSIDRFWNKDMSYIRPEFVISPKAHWHLFDVALDRGEDNCAYALGTWDGERRIGFRWNGDDESAPLGNPQSRGLPTWTILDPALNEAVVALLAPEKQALAKNFLGLRTGAERQTIMLSIRKFHEERAAKIASPAPPVPLLGAGTLLMHLVPFSAMSGQQSQAIGAVFENPDRFPPIGADHARDSKIDYTGLLIGSNRDGLAHQQRAYVHVSQSGVIESVASSLASGRERNFLELPRIEAIIIQYTTFYINSLRRFSLIPPIAVAISLLGTNGMRFVQDFITNVIPEDLPYGLLRDDRLYFGDALFEEVPTSDSECAKVLDSILNRLANAAGRASSPYFDVNGNYTLKARVGL